MPVCLYVTVCVCVCACVNPGNGWKENRINKNEEEGIQKYIVEVGAFDAPFRKDALALTLLTLWAWEARQLNIRAHIHM